MNNIYNNMNMVKPTYDQFIIKPPSKNETHGRISDIYVLDSRERNNILYPKSCDYRHKIDDEYKDVISVELIQAQIPNTGYNIHDGNNQLLIKDASGSSHVIKLTNGEYTNESLINYLNGSKGNLFYKSKDNSNQYFNFNLDTDTNLIKIQSNKHFTFNNIDYNKIESKTNILNNCERMNIDDYFKSINFNSIDKTLGFKRKAYDSSNNIDECLMFDCSKLSINSVPINLSTNNYQIQTNTSNNCDLRSYYNIGDYLNINNNVYKITSIVNENTLQVFSINGTTPLNNDDIDKNYYIEATNVFNLVCPDYVILDIPQFHLIKSEQTSIRDSFAIIPLDNKCKTVIDNTQSENKRKKYFNPPMPRLSNINIKFKRYDGSFYDFNGKEHLLVFKITCLNQPAKYNDFNT